MAHEASEVTWSVIKHMDERPYGYFRPSTIAQALGFTRAEVLLALWLMRKDQLAEARRDGRWFSRRR